MSCDQDPKSAVPHFVYTHPGEAKVDGVIEFLKGLPGLQQKERPAAAAAGNGGDSDGEAPAAAAGAGDTPAAGGVGKVLVFAHHQGVLDAIQSRLCEAQHLGFIRIDGRTSGADRQVRTQQLLREGLSVHTCHTVQPAECLLALHLLRRLRPPCSHRLLHRTTAHSACMRSISQSHAADPSAPLTLAHAVHP